MSTEDHLELILDYCNTNLELASSRTPGPWVRYFLKTTECHRIRSGGVDVVVTDFHCSNYQQRENDARFTERCAGAAEAGWKATIAAIDITTRMRSHYGPMNTILHALIREQEDAILAAYPLTLIAP